MTFTIIYVHNSKFPRISFTFELEARNHEEALFRFINLPGGEDAFVVATVAGTNACIGNTGPLQLWPKHAFESVDFAKEHRPRKVSNG